MLSIPMHTTGIGTPPKLNLVHKYRSIPKSERNKKKICNATTINWYTIHITHLNVLIMYKMYADESGSG